MQILLLGGDKAAGQVVETHPLLLHIVKRGGKTALGTEQRQAFFLLIDRVPPDAALLYYRIDSPDAVRSINLYRKRSRYLSQAVRAFLELSGR